MNDDKRFFEWVGTGLALVIVLTVLWMLAEGSYLALSSADNGKPTDSFQTVKK